MIRTNYCARILCATATCALLLSLSDSALAAQATATVSATVLQPVTLTKTSDLEFGKIVAGPSASTVTMTSGGQFRCGTGITCLDTHNMARFSVNGIPGQLVSVQLDNQIVLSSAGGVKMPVALEASATSMKLGSSPNNVISVGGTLSVAAYQAEGIYTGLFTITVNYN